MSQNLSSAAVVISTLRVNMQVDGGQVNIMEVDGGQFAIMEADGGQVDISKC